MTDILEGISVIFEKPLGEDDAEKIIDAILQIRGVLNVDRVISTSDTLMAATRERYKMQSKLLNYIQPICFDPEKSD
jgi:hypothetical protein